MGSGPKAEKSGVKTAFAEPEHGNLIPVSVHYMPVRRLMGDVEHTAGHVEHRAGLGPRVQIIAFCPVGHQRKVLLIA